MGGAQVKVTVAQHDKNDPFAVSEQEKRRFGERVASQASQPLTMKTPDSQQQRMWTWCQLRITTTSWDCCDCCCRRELSRRNLQVAVVVRHGHHLPRTNRRQSC